MKVIDSHCHIHDKEFFDDAAANEVYNRAVANGVGMICVATDRRSSEQAIGFCSQRDWAFAVVGVHPHEAKHGVEGIEELLKVASNAVVGIGEIGLDYYYNHSERDVQISALEKQLQWAVDYQLPVSFHVREAFDDFWPIFDNFQGIRGVLHSYTDTPENLQRAYGRGLYIGVNGISTFTKQSWQQQMYTEIPLDKICLETDAPFLTPAPLRGNMNEPSFVRRVAEHLAATRDVDVDQVISQTTDNTRKLFAI